MKVFYCAGVLLLCFALPARAVNVYTGCAVPKTTHNNVWYFDPVHGHTQDAGGTGTQTAPWDNLNALIKARPGYSHPLLKSAPYLQVPVPGQPAVTKTGPNAGPIAPGDEILLMSGNYGDVWLGGLNAEIANSDFVTVAAAPGQTPVLTSLFVAETNKWVFDGLKVQSLKPAALSGNPLVTIKDGGATLQTLTLCSRISIISSQDNVQAWGQAQWVANARNGFSARAARGAEHDVRFTHRIAYQQCQIWRALFANKLVFSNNQLDHFGGDAIDYGATDLAITKNNIHDAVDVGDGNHPDAMQGVLGVLAPGAALNYFRNVLIDSNLIIRQTDPKLCFRTSCRASTPSISDWTNVTVSNNVVVTSACWGIDFSSIHNSLIINNTVVGDGLMPTPGCTATVAVGDKSHEGPSSSNTALRNDLASRLIIYNLDSGVEADHNVIMHGSGGGALIAWYSGSLRPVSRRPGKIRRRQHHRFRRDGERVRQLQPGEAHL